MEYPFKDLQPLDEVLEREGYYKDWTHLDPKVFYSLTQISNYIKTKGYGVDVRLLIAQLAEHFSLKTTQINQIELFFKDVMQELAENKDYHSLPEISGARGGFDTLGERLDDTAAQLQRKPNRTETGWATLNTFDESTRAILQGLEPGEINAVLGEKNVKPINTTFFDVIPYATFDMERGAILHSGLPDESDIYIRSSDKIPVESDKEYTLRVSNDYLFIVRGYDITGLPISAQRFSDVGDGKVITFSDPRVKSVALSTFGTITPASSPHSLATEVWLEDEESFKLKEETIPEKVTNFEGRIESLESESQSLIEPNDTNFIRSNVIGTFIIERGALSDIGVEEPSAIHVRSDNSIPIKTNIEYTIVAPMGVVYRVYGYDKFGKYILGQHFSEVENGKTFQFSNEAVTSIKITTNTLVVEDPTSPFVDGYSVQLIDPDIRTGLLPEYTSDREKSAITHDYHVSTVFVPSSDFGSQVFRIPFGVATKHGTIIAGSDIRMTGYSDFGDNRIGVTRSTDQGLTWEYKQQVIVNNSAGGAPRAMDGLALYDNVNDVVYVFGCKLTEWSPWYGAGASKDEWDFVYVKSTDDGKTWSEEISLKTLIDDFPDRDRFLTGVGSGTQMKDGTLVVPIQYSKNGVIKSGIIYSLDFGENWKMSGGEIPDSTSENNVVETSEGTLMMNARMFSGEGKRYFYETNDLGETWSALPSNDLENAGSIIQGADCMGSTIKYSAPSGKEHVIASMPYTTTSKRANLTLFKTTNGTAWESVGTIYIDEFPGYSCLISNGGKLFILVELGGGIQMFDITIYVPSIVHEPNMLPLDNN